MSSHHLSAHRHHQPLGAMHSQSMPPPPATPAQSASSQASWAALPPLSGVLGEGTQASHRYGHGQQSMAQQWPCDMTPAPAAFPLIETPHTSFQQADAATTACEPRQLGSLHNAAIPTPDATAADMDSPPLPYHVLPPLPSYGPRSDTIRARLSRTEGLHTAQVPPERVERLTAAALADATERINADPLTPVLRTYGRWFSAEAAVGVGVGVGGGGSANDWDRLGGQMPSAAPAAVDRSSDSRLGDTLGAGQHIDPRILAQYALTPMGYVPNERSATVATARGTSGTSETSEYYRYSGAAMTVGQSSGRVSSDRTSYNWT